MRTIKLSTAYQLVLTALLFGACLGIVSSRVSGGFQIPARTVQAKALTAYPPYTTQIASDTDNAHDVNASNLHLAQNVLKSELALVTGNQADERMMTYPFVLSEQHQHAEQITPRLYLYVHDQLGALGNFTVRVRKDGLTLPTMARTTASLPSYTWPSADARRHFTNLKLEFPHVTVAGQWEVQLIDTQGNVVGPTAQFDLTENDRNQELYVRYTLR